MRVFTKYIYCLVICVLTANLGFAQAPTISSFSPTSGSIGTLVTITGTNLNNIDTIKIGGVSAIKVSASSNSLVALVMPGAMTGTIYLRNNNGNVTSSTNFIRIAGVPPARQQGNKLVGTGNIGGSNQGVEVSISADGNTAIVGGYYDSIYKGAVWIYTRTGDVWNQQGAKLVGTGSIGTNILQGYSVGLSADGNTAIVGGYLDNNGEGAVWIFARSGGIWIQQGNKLVGTGDIGAAYQGASVSISADGNTAIVGGYTDNNGLGAVWIYTRNGGIWSQQGGKLVGTGAIGAARQGVSVSLSADGNTAIVGGEEDNSSQGAVWVYIRNGGIWSQQGGKLVGTGAIGAARQGNSVSLSADGNTAIVGGADDSIGKGAAWIYTRSGVVWSQQGSKLVGTGAIGAARQGASVSVSADGNTAIVGGYNDNTAKGAAWIYIRTGSVWSQQGNKRRGTTTSLGDVYQGRSVRISSDGNTAIVGGPSDNYNQGALWVFHGALISTNANLSALATSIGTLTPVFNSGITSYVSSTTSTNVTVTPIKEDSNASIQVRVNGGTYTSINSGSLSSSLPLNVGTNMVYIKVTAQDSNIVKIYTITIIRDPQLPIITSFTPSSGPVGTLVTITGNNLGSASNITIGGTSAIVVSNTETSAVAMVMPGSIKGNIGITTLGGSFTSVPTFEILSIALPSTQLGSKLICTGNIGAAQLGYSVSVSADGNTAILGGYADNTDQGAAWVYTRSGSVWSQQGSKLVGIGNIGAARQGFSVSISADGNTAAVGGYQDNNGEGAVWIFTRSAGIWSQQGNKLVGTGSFGAAEQGYSVSISADGNTVLIGGKSDDNNRGAVWVFTRSGGAWSQQGNKLVGTGFIGGQSSQGYSVSISADGNTSVSGGPFDDSGRGAVWVYTRSGGVWSQQGNKLSGTDFSATPNQGFSVNLSANGNTVILGGPMNQNNRGAAWVFNRSGGVWSQQGNKLFGTGATNGISQQGISVSLSANGNIALVGGNSEEATWIFTRSGGSWSQQGSKLQGVGGIGLSGQGRSVSLSADGSTAIFGGNNDNSGQGAAWVFFSLSLRDANLSSIALSAGILSPVFDSTITAYSTSVNASTTSITLTPIRLHANSTIQVQINSGAYSTVVSGLSSSPLSLNVGINVINVKVTAQDGVTIKIYTITVTRLSQPTIISFSPSSGSVGTLVTIIGTNLNYIDTISFGGVSAIKISSTINSLVAMVMPGTITGAIYLANNSGNATSANNFTIINSITPVVQHGGKLIDTRAITNSSLGRVRISADGNTALVSNGNGTVLVFTRSGFIWSTQGNLLSFTGNIGNASFGGSIDISADGNTAIVGGAADNNDQGAVWIFTRSGGVWTQQGNKLVGTGNIVASRQGIAVSLSADGNTAIVGGSNDNYNQGAVWVFTRSGGIWSQQGSKLTGTYTWIGAHLGGAVSLSADGKTIIACGSSNNRVIVYTFNGAFWSQQGNELIPLGATTSNISLGSSVSLSADGNTALVGATNDSSGKGAAWVFIRIGGVWSQQGNKLVGTGASAVAYQGVSVSLSADGNTAFVGGSANNSNQGATWIYKRSGGVWSQLGSKLVGTGAIGQACQGASVSISSDGNTAMVGGPCDNSNKGAVWVFGAPLSANANLSAATLSTGILSPIFTPVTTAYNTSVTNATTSVKVNLVKADSNAIIKVRINGGTYVTAASGIFSDSLALNVGLNTIDIKVTAQDGITEKIYTITVLRISINANLSNISLIGASYLPLFNPDTLLYSASVLFGVNNVSILPSLADTFAQIKLKTNNSAYTSIDDKKISALLHLNVGSNAIYIKVTAQDSSVNKIYQFNIVREPAVPPSAMSYAPASVVATRTFTNINANPIYLGDTITSFSIIPSLPAGLSLNTSTGKISGKPAIVLPQTVFTITGTNSSGSTTASFTLTVKAIAPNTMSYSPANTIATRTITNVNIIPTYQGDSITSFNVSPSLPIGVTLNTITGKISGIAAVTIPKTVFTIEGTNTGGITTASFTLTVNKVAPSAMNYEPSNIIAIRTVTNINTVPVYLGDSIQSFSITPNLPSGVVLNSTTGQISGIPTVSLSKTLFRVVGTNTGGSYSTSLVLTVEKMAPSAMSYSPSSIIANRTTTNINATPTYLGDSIINFSIAPSLPTGVSFNTTTGLISGIPSVNLPQTIFTITGTNSGGSTTATFTLIVNPAISISEVNANIFSNLSFKPNPFNNELEISFVSSSKEASKLVITDALGKEIYTKTIQSIIGNNNFMIDEAANFKAGIYFARLANENGFSQSFKLVKN
jgi:hypothetical protein